MWFLTFLLTLFLSLIIYCVPVLIYRFGIRHGAPLESKWKATWVGWIFWICSFTALCLYYLIAGYYDDGDFSVRAGLPDILCMGINWLLLYLPFNRTAQAKPKCTKCGAPLAPNAKFCTECGEKFVPKPVVNTMICPGCGKTIKSTNFCPECGAKTSPKIEEDNEIPREPTFDEMFGNDHKTQPTESNSASPAKKVTKPIIIFALLVIAFFIVIISITLILVENPKHPGSSTSPACSHSYNLEGYCLFCGKYDQLFDKETECAHVYGNDGYCFYCRNYDESFKLDPYDYLSDFIIKNGNLNSQDNIYIYNFYTSDSWFVSIWYSPSDKEFTLSCDYIFSGSECNTYLSFARSNFTDFVAGMTQGDDALCAASSTISKSSITTNFHVVFNEFEGQKDLESPFSDMCDPMIVKSFKEFETFIISHGYSLSDFGFTNFIH